MLPYLAQARGGENTMENVFMILVLAGVFIFGFFVVDLLSRSLHEGRRDRYHRLFRNKKDSRSTRFFHR